MKAIILAAGRGTRMRPFTTTVAKPMIPLFHTPVMELLVELLARHNVRQIMVNTSYLAPGIEGYFRDGAHFGVEMAYSFEGRKSADQFIDEPLGSAGALRKIQTHSGFFDETFMVMCGDAVIDLDLSALLDFHRRQGATVTVALKEVPADQVSNYGIAVLDEHQRITSFQEKPAAHEAKSLLANTGIYIFEPSVIDLIPPVGAYDIGSQLFPRLVESGAGMYGVALPFQWLDIGKLPDYYQVMRQALCGEVHGVQLPGHSIRPGIHCGLNVSIDLEACEIHPPVYIGGSSTIEPGCRIIGPALIGPGCIIESGALVEESMIFDYTRIGALASIRNMIVSGDYCVDSTGLVIDLQEAKLDGVITDARTNLDLEPNTSRELLELLADWGA